MKAEVKKRCGVAFGQRSSSGERGREASGEDYSSVSTLEAGDYQEGRDRRGDTRRRRQGTSG